MKAWQAHLLWLLPLFTGAGSYFAKRTEVPLPSIPVKRETQEGSKNVVQSAVMPLNRDAVKERLASMDSAALRTLMLDLKSSRTGGLHEDYDLKEWIDEAAKELGRKDQEANFRWLDENFPAQCSLAMKEWAAIDPDAALRSLTAISKHFSPCSSETLYILLQHQVQTGADSLNTAISQIPWYLLRNSSSAEPGGLEFPSGADIKPWIDSGAIQTLAGRGVKMQGLLNNWMHQDPSAALKAWLSWPTEDQSGTIQGLEDMLDCCENSGDIAAFLDRAVADADPATLEKFKSIYARIPESRYDAGYQGVARERVPHLAPPSDDEDAEASGNDDGDK